MYCSESVHRDFEDFWTGSSYKREKTHPEYDSQYYKCIVAYNSRRIGKKIDVKNISQ